MPNGIDVGGWRERTDPWAQYRGAPTTPPAPAQPTWTAGQLVRETGFPIPPDVTFGEPSPGEWLAWQRRIQEEADKVDLGGAQAGFKTFSEAFGELPNENWEVYKNEFGRFDVRRKQAPAPLPTGLTPAQQAAQQQAEQELALRREQWEWEQQQAGAPSPFQQQQLSLQEQQMAQAQTQQRQQQAQQQAQFQAQLGFQQEQAQLQAELERQQYGAQLAANPMSWLQYASYTGEAPLTQPWMVPLGAQGAEPSLQVGQPLIQGEQTFANLPQLRTPSTQLQARWGPTAQAQYLGYQQARTGVTPQESLFRLGSQRAPTGSFTGFSSFR